MGTILFPIGLGLLLLALTFLLLLINERQSQRQRLVEEHHRALGLPPGELVYEDADGLGEPLYSSQFPLVGKPDYIVQLADGRPVPVESQPAVTNVLNPYPHHVIQISVYCLILEDYFELPPTHGILRYGDRDFTVEYTPTLRKKVIRLLNEMEQSNEYQPPPLARQSASKCRSCLFQPICPVGYNK